MGFGLSRTSRIVILLVIDVCFFFVELIVGYAVGSLALIADSFHMLNDVMSLIVALYAIKLSKASASSRYSYGWHRAEILAALINGVFLLALCFSIFMEAIEKFVNTPIVSNPKLVVIVGTLGLLSNIVGLFLFHDHGHAHSHSHSKTPAAVEDVETGSSESDALLAGNTKRRHAATITNYGHPVQNRQYLYDTANDMQFQSNDDSSDAVTKTRSMGKGDVLIDIDDRDVSSSQSNDAGNTQRAGSTQYSEGRDRNHSAGHSHEAGSMNMRALVLHVLGDALGNVGVIATGLIIWLSHWSFKYYFDPIISLVITVIIFSSALPLVRSASFILLQGVPSTVSLDSVRGAIRDVPGVLSIHELHVWQLSESKLVASVHVCISSRADFMSVAANIRKVLHDHGMHSSTIQPEFYATALPEEDLVTSVDTRCLLACPVGEDCNTQTCCPPGQTPQEFRSRAPSPPS